MENSIDQLNAQLPKTIELGRYVPKRVEFSTNTFDPLAVRDPIDLPPYLILGNLDPASAHISEGEWSARWQGLTSDTYFQIRFKADNSRYEIAQSWKGVDGGFCFHSGRVPLQKVIADLYTEFPSEWDAKAKEVFEHQYQLTYIGHQRDFANFCGVPDGPFMTIAIPLHAQSLRTVFNAVNELVEKGHLPFSFTANACRVFQAVNYIQTGRASWATDPAEIFYRSISATGLIPTAAPNREEGPDGSAALTLRRHLYVVLVVVPFVGLSEMLHSLIRNEGVAGGPSNVGLGFDMQPFIFPFGLEVQAEHIAFVDHENSMRTFWLLNDKQRYLLTQEPEAPEDSAIDRVLKVERISQRQMQIISDALGGDRMPI